MGQRCETDGEPNDKLRAIQFDKLFNLFAGIWDELFRMAHRSEAKGSDSGEITFPCPLSEMPGKHGRGRAVIHDAAPPEFVTSVLYKLQQDGTMHLFEITPPPEAPGSPGHYKTTVEPGVLITDQSGFLDGFSDTEKELLYDIGNAIKHLSPGELRALGTHEDAAKTVEDIKREFRYAARVLSRILAMPVCDEAMKSDMQRLLEYADESVRKAKRNRVEYESAHRVVGAELVLSNVKEAFAARHRPASDIWGHADIAGLTLRANKLFALAKYLKVLIADDGRGSRHSESDSDDLESLRAQADSFGYKDLPRTSVQALGTNGKLSQRIKEVLIITQNELCNDH